MTRTESIALIQIHAEKLATLSAQLKDLLRSQTGSGAPAVILRAAQALPVINHEVNILAGHVAKLLPHAQHEAHA